jgi:hypothetical protein
MTARRRKNLCLQLGLDVRQSGGPQGPVTVTDTARHDTSYGTSGDEDEDDGDSDGVAGTCKIKGQSTCNSQAPNISMPCKPPEGSLPKVLPPPAVLKGSGPMSLCYTDNVSQDPFPCPPGSNWVNHALSVVEDDGRHALYLGFVNNDLKMNKKPPQRRSRSARASLTGAGGK